MSATSTNDTAKALILNRAVELGINPTTESNLFWIAEQSLKAKLPDDWMECQAEDGNLYYYNVKTEESVWEHPSLEHYRQLYQKVKGQRNSIRERRQSRTGSITTPTNQPLKLESFNDESKSSPRTVAANALKKAASPSEDLSDSRDVSPLAANKISPQEAYIEDKASRSVGAAFEKEKGKATKVAPKEKQSDPKVEAANNMRHKNMEKHGDAVYWRSRFESKEAEKDNLESQVKRLERDLQENLLQQAHLIDEKHKTVVLSDTCATTIRNLSSSVVEHLSKRGFAIDTRTSAGKGDLQSATEDICKIVNTLMDVDMGNKDERGFSLVWNGALSRIKRELDFSFTYDGDEYTVDTIDLKTKLADLAQMIIAYGSYLGSSDKTTYTSILLDDIVKGCSGDTLVPIEAVIRAQESHLTIDGRGDVVLDSPCYVNKMRRELDDCKQKNLTLGSEVEQKKHEIEVLQVKLIALQKRLDDSLNRDDAISSKFAALTKTLEDWTSTHPVPQKSSNHQNDQYLRNEVISLNKQLDLANKRAVDAEKRLETLLDIEKKMKTELTSIELNLKLKLDKRKAKLHELAEQKHDLERVSKELYEELQNALIVSQRLQEDCETLQDELARCRATDGDSAVLREKLEIEYERSSQLEDEVNRQHDEIDRLTDKIHQLNDENDRAQMEIVELREDLASVMFEFEKQKNRNQVIVNDNHALEECTKDLRRSIMNLNDKIVEIKGSLRVFCRTRPIFNEEIRRLNIPFSQIETLVRYPEYNMVEFNAIPFEFDRVFSPDCDQDEVYEEVDPYVRSVLSGCRACIFAYGQTGSGKTYTMIGPPENRGVTSRALETLFTISKSNFEIRTEIFLSIFEVYNENIIDLLSLDPETQEDHLEIKIGKYGTFINGLSEWPIRCLEEADSLIDRATATRIQFAGGDTERCSRSHFIVLVKVDRTNLRNNMSSSGVLYLVDLAGSERIKLSTATGAKLREAQNINKSLTVLGEVIASLAAGHKHVPYRNSKLTFLLQDTLKESSKVLMFVNITPSPEHTGESTCSLQFATRCRSVTLGHPKKNITYPSISKSSIS